MFSSFTWERSMSKNNLKSLLLAMLLAAGCSEDSEPATALVVSLKHDLSSELASAVVRVYPTTANLALDADKPSSETTVRAADLGKPVVINHAGVDELLMVVRGLNAAGAPIIEQAVRARFADGKSLAVHVFLGSSCRNKACSNPGETCYAEPGAAQCGTCAPIATADGAAVDSAGEEASWQPRVCAPGDAGIDADAGDADAYVDASDAGADAADADARAADVGDADAGDGGCMIPASSANPCTLSPQCGCAPGQGCSVKSFIDPANPELACEVRGKTQSNQVCTSHTDCAAGLACITASDTVKACRPYCLKDDDCTGAATCSRISSNGLAIAGYGACFVECKSDSECDTRCCAEGSCSPAAACKPPALKDGETCGTGVTCAGSNSARGGVCVTFAPDDAGVSDSQCFSLCNTPADCNSGCCYPLLKDGRSTCVSRSGVTSIAPGMEATYCGPG
jgi:hypothetical protein